MVLDNNIITVRLWLLKKTHSVSMALRLGPGNEEELSQLGTRAGLDSLRRHNRNLSVFACFPMLAELFKLLMAILHVNAPPMVCASAMSGHRWIVDSPVAPVRHHYQLANLVQQYADLGISRLQRIRLPFANQSYPGRNRLVKSACSSKPV